MTKNLVPLTWYGGKASHLKWLLPIINRTTHKLYCEPFGGSAAVLLNKNPSKIEIYNDLYGDVVNFFRVLRDRGEELIRLLELTPYSREELGTCLDRSKMTDLEKARAFFVAVRQTVSGLVGKSTTGQWSHSLNNSRRGMGITVSSWLSSVEMLPEAVVRLKRVEIENLPASKILPKYDTKETLFYLDPPYLMETRTGGEGYALEMTEENHKALLEQVKELKGKVILSGYASPLYEQELVGWGKVKVKERAASSGSRNGKTAWRNEVLWTNFDPWY